MFLRRCTTLSASIFCYTTNNNDVHQTVHRGNNDVNQSIFLIHRLTDRRIVIFWKSPILVGSIIWSLIIENKPPTIFIPECLQIFGNGGGEILIRVTFVRF